MEKIKKSSIRLQIMTAFFRELFWLVAVQVITLVLMFSILIMSMKSLERNDYLTAVIIFGIITILNTTYRWFNFADKTKRQRNILKKHYL